MCLIGLNLGPPETIVHDAGRTLTGLVFQSNTGMLHTRTKSVSMNSSNSITIAERYQSPIRSAFTIVCMEAPDLDMEAFLQMDVKAINYLAGLDALVPTLLDFGSFP